MKLNHVGIDVSAKTFTVIIDHEGDRTEAFDLPNDATGHKKLIRMATQKGFHAKVVLEATGVYSLDLALALHRAKRVDVMVANAGSNRSYKFIDVPPARSACSWREWRRRTTRATLPRSRARAARRRSVARPGWRSS